MLGIVWSSERGMLRLRPESGGLVNRYLAKIRGTSHGISANGDSIDVPK